MIDWIRTNVQGITEAARQVVYLLLGFEILTNQRGEPWTDAQTGLVLAAISAILSLIAAKSSVAAIKVDERMLEAKQKGFDAGHAEGVRVTASGNGG
jgi:hypothetical protein